MRKEVVVVALVLLAGAGAFVLWGAAPASAPVSGAPEERKASEAAALEHESTGREVPAAAEKPAGTETAPVAPPPDTADAKVATFVGRVLASGGRVAVQTDAGNSTKKPKTQWIDSATDLQGRPVVAVATGADGGEPWLADLALLKDLSTLRFSGSERAPDLESLPVLPKLERVEFEGVRVGAKSAASLSRQPGLRRVGVHDTSLDADSMRAFAGLEAVRYLTLDSSRVTDATLAALSSMTKLERLNLDDALISDAGLQHLSRMTSLVELDLTGTRVTGDGFRYLSGLSSLKFVTLDKTRANDEGLRHVAALPALEGLDLEATDVTDAGLVALESSRTLVELVLEGTRVTDAALDVIARIASLKRLNVLNSGVTSDGVARFKSARPDVKVEG
jgi:hypothetical protein